MRQRWHGLQMVLVADCAVRQYLCALPVLCLPNRIHEAKAARPNRHDSVRLLSYVRLAGFDRQFHVDRSVDQLLGVISFKMKNDVANFVGLGCTEPKRASKTATCVRVLRS